MPIPESQKTHQDVIDLIIEGSQTVETVELDDGHMQKQLILDPEKVYWSTRLVNSPVFGRFVYELKTLESLALQCYNNMSISRAKVIAQQILAIVSNFKYSIDAKSSESVRDHNNTQTTLIDKIIKNKQERTYTVKGEMKKSLIDGILGRDAEKDRDND